MHTKHVHRPTFWGFLLGEKHGRVKGRRVSLYRCRDCGAGIRIASSQQAFHDFLPGLGIILGLFLALIMISLRVPTPEGIWLAALIAGIVLLWLAVYGIAYRFTRFVPVPPREEVRPAAGPGRRRGPGSGSTRP